MSDDEFGPLKSIRISGEPRPPKPRHKPKQRILYGHELGQLKGRDLYEVRHGDKGREWLGGLGKYAADPNDDLWRVNWKAFNLPFVSVYLISPENGWPTKVGMSDWPAGRVAGLQTAHWSYLAVAACWICPDRPKARKAEATAQAIIRSQGKHLMGEWFDVRADEAVPAIERAFEVHGLEALRRLPPVEKFDAVFRSLDEAYRRREQHRSFFAGTDADDYYGFEA